MSQVDRAAKEVKGDVDFDKSVGGVVHVQNENTSVASI